MSELHLKDIEKYLRKNNWDIIAKNGNEYDISGYWIITNKRYSDVRLTIAFDGLDDMIVLPIEKSYGCHIVENKSISLYFYKSKIKWKHELDNFIKSICKYSTD